MLVLLLAVPLYAPFGSSENSASRSVTGEWAVYLEPSQSYEIQNGNKLVLNSVTYTDGVGTADVSVFDASGTETKIVGPAGTITTLTLDGIEYHIKIGSVSTEDKTSAIKFGYTIGQLSPGNKDKSVPMPNPRPIEVGAYESYTLNAKTGWNLLSAPMRGKVSEQSCGQIKVYLFSDSGKFKRIDLDQLHVAPMQAFWVKASNDCTIEFMGRTFESQDVSNVELNTGWSIIGAPYHDTSFDQVKGSCDVSSGPWSYDPTGQKWIGSNTLSPGIGYVLKTSAACELGSSSGDIPPFPSS